MVATAKRAASAKAAVVKLSPEAQAALLQVETQYKNYDVVWARMTGFPWWPGLVFLRWEVAIDGGVPLPKDLLVINEPEERIVNVTVNGKPEQRVVKDRYCLVMFLDKGDWFVANMNLQVQPFTSNYAANFKWSGKKGNRSNFNLALRRALKLLHLGDEYTEEELAVFNRPLQHEKRPRIESMAQPKKLKSVVVQADSEYEDEYESSEKDDDDDTDFEPEHPVLPGKLKSRMSVPARKLEAEFVDQAPAAKPKAQTVKKSKQPPALQNGDATAVVIDDQADQKVSGRGRKKSATKATLVVIDDSPVAAAQAKHSKKAQKKEASGKATAPDEEIDGSLSVRAHKLAEVDIVYAGLDKRTKQYKQLKANGKIPSGAAGKKQPPAKKKKARLEPSDESSESEEMEEDEDDDGDVEFIENPNLHKHGDNVCSDGAPSVQSSTPLSQIWTTHVEDEQVAPAEDAVKTLVYKQDFVWDEELFTNNKEVPVEKREAIEEHASPARDRPLGKRQMRSVQQSHIRQNLMNGNLDPHTMVQCEAYRSKDDAENLNSRSRGSSSLEPPFQIQVHPDAVFVCDLHSHLATCEIIGFLGGRWDEATKTLYIQAAFPCRSLMIDGDDGSTDVEMDPGSEIELREIIQNAQLEVVGWYHSHPAFAPDPSIRDIENQTSYQQLFQRRVERKPEEGQKAIVEISEPFVGLIVGTYDTKRDTPVSLFRYFHTRGEKVSGGARREIYMPYELIPKRRHYRTVLDAERRVETSSLPMYPSVFEFVFGKQCAPRMKSVELPKDNAVPEIVFTGIDPVEISSKKDASLVQSRKRKLSSDLAVKTEIPVKKVKGKRHQKLPEATRALVVDTKPVTIDLVDEDEAKAEDDGSVESGSTTTPPSQDSNNGSAGGGRRRGRKPVQTQRKSATFYNNASTKDDRSPNHAQSGAVATHIEVYGAFGSASGVAKSGAEKENLGRAVKKENLGRAVKKEEGNSVSNVVSVSEGNYVFLAFEDAKVNEKPAASLLQGHGEQQKPLETDDETRPSSLVAVSADEVVPKSQSPESHEHQKNSSEVVSVQDEVIPESQSQSPPVDVEADAEASELSANSSDHVVQVEDEQATLPGQVGTAIVIAPSHAERANDDTVVFEPAVIVKVEEKSVELKSTNILPVVTQLSVSPTTLIVKPEATASTVISAEAVIFPASDAPQGVVSMNGTSSSLAPDKSCLLEECSSHEERSTKMKQTETEQSGVSALNKYAKLSSVESIFDEPKPSELLPIKSDEDVTSQEALQVPRSQTGASTRPESHALEAVNHASPAAPAQDESAAMKVDADEPSQAEPTDVQMAVEVGIAQTAEASALPEFIVEKRVSMEIDDKGTPQVSSQLPAVVKVSTEVEMLFSADSAEVKKYLLASNESPILTPAVKEELEAIAKSATAEVVGNEAKATDELPIQPSQQADSTMPEAATGPLSASAVKLEEIAFVVPVPAEAKAPEELPSPTDSTQAEAKSQVTPTIKPDAELLNEVEVAIDEPATASSDAVEETVMKSEKTYCDVVMVEPEANANSEELSPVKEKASPRPAMLFGSGRQVEDIRTSLERIRPLLEKMVEARDAQQQVAKTSKPARRKTGTQSKAGRKEDAAAEVIAVAKAKPDAEATDGEVNLFERQQEHLNRLRTKYGGGISGCAEQVITLVDYYRDFERRIDLKETWKAKMNKLSKIEASMGEYVRYVNLPVHLRYEFVQDVVKYLQLSWELTRPAN